MNLLDRLFDPGLLGLGFVLLFFIFMLVYAGRNRKTKPALREIPAFSKLRRAVGLDVEAGSRLHVTLGWGSMNGLQGAASLVGLSALGRIARAASLGDRPPVTTSGDSVLNILSQDTLQSAYRSIDIYDRYDPLSAQLTGLTPFGYAAGTLPVIYDQEVAANILLGHFGSEVALIADAGERAGSLTVGGSDDLTAQAVIYATAEEPLIGEELYASGAYLQVGLMHLASLLVQDLARWILILVILVLAGLKLAGVW